MDVAELTYDHLDKRKGNVKFSLAGLTRFYYKEFDAADLEELPKTSFRLYDDDNELYYSGWLKDDHEALVQQFVLSWAMADSGCTRIDVKKNGEWVTEIG